MAWGRLVVAICLMLSPALGEPAPVEARLDELRAAARQAFTERRWTTPPEASGYTSPA